MTVRYCIKGGPRAGAGAGAARELGRGDELAGEDG
jgi:hypothetical protein